MSEPLPTIPTQSPFTYPIPNSSASPSFTQDDTFMPNPSASPSFTQDDTFMPEPIQPMPTFTQPAVHTQTNPTGQQYPNNVIVSSIEQSKEGSTEDHMPDYHHYDDARIYGWQSMLGLWGNEESKKMKKTMLKHNLLSDQQRISSISFSTSGRSDKMEEMDLNANGYAPLCERINIFEEDAGRKIDFNNQSLPELTEEKVTEVKTDEQKLWSPLIPCSNVYKNYVGLGFSKSTLEVDEVFDLATPIVFTQTQLRRRLNLLYQLTRLQTLRPMHPVIQSLQEPDQNDIPPAVDIPGRTLPESDVRRPKFHYCIPIPCTSKAASILSGIVDSVAQEYDREQGKDFEIYCADQGGIVKFGVEMVEMIRKSTIRTSKLDFDNLYYVERAQHFNLFSVSQDLWIKKNKVLFTYTDCLVLSEEFQLPDASQVVLRIPRNKISTNSTSQLATRTKVLLASEAKASLDEITQIAQKDGSVSNSKILCQAEADIRDQGVSAVKDPAGVDSAVKDSAGIDSADGVSTGSPSADRCSISPAEELNPFPTNGVNTIPPQSLASFSVEPTSIAKALGILIGLMLCRRDATVHQSAVWKLVPLPWLLHHGHRQEEGIDYDEVLSPVARIWLSDCLAFASYTAFWILLSVGKLTVTSDYAVLMGKRKSTTGGCQFWSKDELVVLAGCTMFSAVSIFPVWTIGFSAGLYYGSACSYLSAGTIGLCCCTMILLVSLSFLLEDWFSAGCTMVLGSVVYHFLLGPSWFCLFLLNGSAGIIFTAGRFVSAGCDYGSLEVIVSAGSYGLCYCYDSFSAESVVLFLLYESQQKKKIRLLELVERCTEFYATEDLSYLDHFSIEGKAHMPDLDIPTALSLSAEDAQARQLPRRRTWLERVFVSRYMPEDWRQTTIIEPHDWPLRNWNVKRALGIVRYRSTQGYAAIERIRSHQNQQNDSPSHIVSIGISPFAYSDESSIPVTGSQLIHIPVLSRVATEPDSDDEVLAEAFTFARSVGYSVLCWVLTNCPDDEIVLSQRGKVEPISESTSSPPRSRSKHRGVRSDTSLWDRPFDDFLSSEREMMIDIEDYIPPYSVWSIVKIVRLAVARYEHKMNAVCEWLEIISQELCSCTGLNTWENRLYVCGQVYSYPLTLLEKRFHMMRLREVRISFLPSAPIEDPMAFTHKSWTKSGMSKEGTTLGKDFSNPLNGFQTGKEDTPNPINIFSMIHLSKEFTHPGTNHEVAALEIYVASFDSSVIEISWFFDSAVPSLVSACLCRLTVFSNRSCFEKTI
ncbi:hypothetical protein Tco_1144952 [Tanacetum coccineum]